MLRNRSKGGGGGDPSQSDRRGGSFSTTLNRIASDSKLEGMEEVSAFIFC
jgi:hypothetical protein